MLCTKKPAFTQRNGDLGPAVPEGRSAPSEDKMVSPEDHGASAEDGTARAEDGREGTEDGSGRTEDGGAAAEDRGEAAEDDSEVFFEKFRISGWAMDRTSPVILRRMVNPARRGSYRTGSKRYPAFIL